MSHQKGTLRVDANATTSPINSNQHLNYSPSTDELFQELVLGVDSNHQTSNSTTLLTTTKTSSPAMADRFPSLEDFSPSECILPNLRVSLLGAIHDH